MDRQRISAKRVRLGAYLLTLSLGVVIGFSLHRVAPRKKPTAVIERRAGTFNHVNPLLACDMAEDVLRTEEIRPFKEKIASYLNSRRDQRGVSSVSVYYRELNDGPWFSIGETERFVPASLRKLPLMIALLKMAERGDAPPLLERRVKADLAGDYNAKQNIKPSQMLVPGQEYTVRDLLTRMIVFSDNNAFMLLTRVVDPSELDRVYATLRMQNPENRKDDSFLSVQTYASFFRVLYNATYLSKEASDWALQILAQSEFKAGLVSGVPATVEVAHKFGEHSEEGMVQLHDCGIVYYPRHPYLLCLMSKGPTFEFLDDAIVGVSKMVYESVAEQHANHVR